MVVSSSSSSSAPATTVSSSLLEREGASVGGNALGAALGSAVVVLSESDGDPEGSCVDISTMTSVASSSTTTLRFSSLSSSSVSSPLLSLLPNFSSSSSSSLSTSSISTPPSSSSSVVLVVALFRLRLGGAVDGTTTMTVTSSCNSASSSSSIGFSSSRCFFCSVLFSFSFSVVAVSSPVSYGSIIYVGGKGRVVVESRGSVTSSMGGVEVVEEDPCMASSSFPALLFSSSFSVSIRILSITFPPSWVLLSSLFKIHASSSLLVLPRIVILVWLLLSSRV